LTNSGNRKAYTAYREADSEQRKAILVERAAMFYAKHRSVMTVHEPQQKSQAPISVPEQDHNHNHKSESTSSISVTLRERDGRKIDTVVSQYEAERRERVNRDADNSKFEFNTIKKELDASRLLANVSRTHGVMPDKYQVTKSKDGSDRIRVGGRNLNVSDFLTQELHLPWRDAARILKQSYAEQVSCAVLQNPHPVPNRDLWDEYRSDWLPKQREHRDKAWQVQKQREQARRADLRREYLVEYQSVRHNKALQPAERKAALSVVNMGKVTKDMEFRAAIAAEREILKARYSMKPVGQYRSYLAERANGGDTDALAELRRQRNPQPAPTGERIEHKTGQQPEAAPIMNPASYKVDKDGNVSYYDQQQRIMFTDKGEAVQFGNTERETLEKGLRLALVKFGTNISVRGGSEEYRNTMVDVAADAGLSVEFSDNNLQERYRLRREAI
jgi:hypothetical protein